MVAVTGHLSPQLEEEYGDFGQMTKRLLAEEGEEVRRQQSDSAFSLLLDCSFVNTRSQPL